MPNISDVARHAGVSKQTVSRVLNDDPRVRPRTRKLVVEATAALGFIPNQAARSLRGSRTRTVGLVLFELNASLIQVVSAVEEVVRERGYSLLVCDSQGDRAIEAANLRRLYEHRVEGLVTFVVSEQCLELELFAKRGISVLAIQTHKMLELPDGVGHVQIPGQQIISRPLSYLAELGHKRVAVISSNRVPYRVRPHALQKATAELGLEYLPSLDLICDDPSDCVSRVTTMLASADRPTAIYSLSHALCPHILEGIRVAGLAIPDDLSFVTVGDSPWTRAYRPPLTTLFFDTVGQGRLMAEYLFARIEGAPTEGLMREMENFAAARLIIRGSCAPPREE